MIAVQPLDVVAIRGGLAVFSVTAVSVTTLSYRWYHVDSQNREDRIDWATTSVLTLTNVQSKHIGEYFCEVRNAGGEVETRRAKLTLIFNNPPDAGDDSYTTSANVPLVVPAPGVLVNDVDANNDPLVALLMTTVSHGTLILNTNGSFTYTPHTNYTGTDSFIYRASDGLNDATPPSATNAPGAAVVTIYISPATNTPPVANPETFTVFNNNVLTIPAAGILDNDKDAEDSSLQAVLVSDVSHGSLSLQSDGSFVYVPVKDYVGNDSFTYSAHDGQVASAPTTVSLLVLPSVRFDWIQMTTQGCQVQVSGPAGSNYVIFASSNLTDWWPICTNAAPSGTLIYTDTSATYGDRFYKAKLE